MSQLEGFLSRLTKVRGRAGNYVACCPAHEDRTPSMTVKEQDGKILVHCFAGCSVQDIVGAVGMDLTDLFPPSAPTYKPQPRVRLFASDLLKVLHLEAQIVAVAAYNLAHGTALTDADRERLSLACERITSAVEASNG